jgi:hypothetical protein
VAENNSCYLNYRVNVLHETYSTLFIGGDIYIL